MDRFFSLGKTSNFRHMGGYGAAGGRRTRADRLYRSGYVNAPDGEVAAAFERLGIAVFFLYFAVGAVGAVVGRNSGA